MLKSRTFGHWLPGMSIIEDSLSEGAGCKEGAKWQDIQIDGRLHVKGVVEHSASSATFVDTFLFLNQGYRMLATLCPLCECVELQDRQGAKYCVACQEVLFTFAQETAFLIITRLIAMKQVKIIQPCPNRLPSGWDKFNEQKLLGQYFRLRLSMFLVFHGRFWVNLWKKRLSQMLSNVHKY